MRILRIMIFCLFCFWAGASAQTISALVNSPEKFDGKLVEVEGELIGDIISGKGGFWVNLLNSDRSIGIWLPDKEKEKIKFLGRYGIQGDFVKITGIFHHYCIEHKGDCDIHVLSLEIVKEGSEKQENLPVEKVIFAFSLGIVSLAAIGILQLLSRKESLQHD